MSRIDKLGTWMTEVQTTEYNGQTRTIVRYHSTEVVEWDKDTIILNSGGWHTHTTKLRMNQASREYDLGYTVWQYRFNWYVDYGEHTYAYCDDMKLDRKRQMVYGQEPIPRTTTTKESEV